MEGMKPLLPPSYGFSINNLSHIFLHLVSEITVINLKILDICSIFYMHYFTGEITRYLSGELEAICLSHSEEVTKVCR